MLKKDVAKILKIEYSQFNKWIKEGTIDEPPKDPDPNWFNTAKRSILQRRNTAEIRQHENREKKKQEFRDENNG